MYYGKNEARHVQRKHRRRSRKTGILFLSLLLIAAAAIGGTLAYLFTNTESVINTFTPSHVTCQVTEDFDGTVKSNVNVRNTGDTKAYIRVKLVTYRVNNQGEHIGGTATIPAFTPGKNWVKYDDGYYYYTLPVEPDDRPAYALIGSIELIGSYDDADGGKQAIEVMAEAIQSEPARAVGEAWGVAISENKVIGYVPSGE